MKQYQWPQWSRNLPAYDMDATTGLFGLPAVGAVQLKKLQEDETITVRDLYAFCEDTRHQFAVFLRKPHARTLRENKTWSMWIPVEKQSATINHYSTLIFGEL